MTTPGLDDRSRDVLKSLIQLHIATGQPVGSETLARMFQRSVSSATLRNIMADLERLGYLTHPHTSAGRMPTDEGYRVWRRRKKLSAARSWASFCSVGFLPSARAASSRSTSMSGGRPSPSYALPSGARNVATV